jgi:hypothetical protein
MLALVSAVMTLERYAEVFDDDLTRSPTGSTDFA